MAARRLSERVLVLVPGGRDAAVASSVLTQAGLQPRVCGSLSECVALLPGGAGMVMVSDEALQSSDLRALAQWVREQAAWSDLPFVVLTRQGGNIERNPAATRLVKTLGNVTFVERPFHATTLISVADSALRARRRQYDTRDHLLQVREAEERLRIALEAGALGDWELSLPEYKLTASPRCKAIFGRRADEPFEYADLQRAVYADDRPAAEAAVARTLSDGSAYDIEYRCLWPDGSLHWVSVKGRVRFHGQGHAESMVGVSMDITARRHAQAEREQLLQELSDERQALEQRVVERTRDLRTANERLVQEMGEREQAEDQLRQAQKIETIGQLVGGVAHDFNNLLMAIIGNLEVLRHRVGSDPGQQRLTDTAMRAAQRGASLTQRLLAFARRQDLRPRSTDVGALLHEMMQLIQRSVGPMVRLQLQAPPSLPAVRIDPNQLEMAVLNLAVNARDAMPEGGSLDVALRVARMDASDDDDLQPGTYVLLSVKDTGQGMDTYTLRRAIEPFFSTKGVGQGTGLGLSMVHGMAKQSGGVFRLHSQVGRGTLAELWLPVSHDEVEASEPVEAAPAPLRSATILVVDDDELVAASTAAILEDLGHTVVEVNSGQEALGALEGGLQPDLMITDHAMPQMTGMELIGEVRVRYPALPVLLATGYAEMPLGSEAQLPRLMKPYTQQQICTEVNRLLGLH
jgi:signal transduction histidine kinase/FixJ family two-component response regulator